MHPSNADTTINVPVSPDEETLLYGRVFRRIVPLLVLCLMAAFIDRFNIGFAKLQMLDDLKFSETVYGLGAGIFFVGYFLFEVPSNMIMHRVGARRWIARILITWGIVSGATCLVSTPMQFYVLRFLLGVAEAGFFPGVILYLTYWFPAARRARFNALFIIGIPLSGVVGNPITGWILSHFDKMGGWAGWQWMFFLEAIPSIVLGFVVLRMLDDRIADARWLSAAEKHVLERNLANDVGAHQTHDVKGAFRNPRLWALAIIYFGLCMGLYGVGFWMPTIIRASGILDTTTIGLLGSIPPLFTVIAMLVNSSHSDRMGERRWHIAVPCTIGAIGLIVSTTSVGNPAIAIASLTAGYMGIMASSPVFWSLATTFMTGIAAAAGIAMINSIGNIAGVISPWLIGWFKDTLGSTDMGMYAIAASLVLGAFVALAQPKPQRNL